MFAERVQACLVLVGLLILFVLPFRSRSTRRRRTARRASASSSTGSTGSGRSDAAMVNAIQRSKGPPAKPTANSLRGAARLSFPGRCAHGWRATTADGQEVRAYGDYLGAVVEPGVRQVEMVFEPTSARIGILISAAAAAFAALLALWASRSPLLDSAQS